MVVDGEHGCGFDFDMLVQGSDCSGAAIIYHPFSRDHTHLVPFVSVSKNTTLTEGDKGRPLPPTVANAPIGRTIPFIHLLLTD